MPADESYPPDADGSTQHVGLPVCRSAGHLAAAALAVPTIVTPKRQRSAADLPVAVDDRKSAIVTSPRKQPSGFGADLAREEHQRRGDAADELWRELVRRVAGSEP